MDIISKNMKTPDEEIAVPDHLDKIEAASNSDTNKVENKTTREKIPCIYCGEMYGGVGGMKRHFHYCSLNPESKKF